MTTFPPEALISKLIYTAQLFRLAQEAEASLHLRQCIELLEPLLNNLNQGKLIVELLPGMMAAQERHDWLALADYLEYELPILLQDE